MVEQVFLAVHQYWEIFEELGIQQQTGVFSFATFRCLSIGPPHCKPHSLHCLIPHHIPLLLLSHFTTLSSLSLALSVCFQPNSPLLPLPLPTTAGQTPSTKVLRWTVFRSANTSSKLLRIRPSQTKKALRFMKKSPGSSQESTGNSWMAWSMRNKR